jgi:hypothetical protein
MKLIILLVLSYYGSLLFSGCNVSRPGNGELPSGQGIAWLYPGDEGIENHPSVVFADNFETGNIEDLKVRWGHMSNRDGKVMSFSDDVPEGSSGIRSLQMTATRGENAGGELYKTFEGGWDTIYLRFYTKFTEDHGFQGHFVALRGAIDPLPYPIGGAGRRAENHFSVTIEPKTTEANKYPTTSHDPPGIWQLYAYWPEMRSWQTPEGDPDGRPNPYYGNSFQPVKPSVAPRGKWIAVELMVRLNTSPEEKNGEMAFWIDGEPVVHFAPGIPRGYWMSSDRYPGDPEIPNARYRNDPGHPDASPFEGFRWRHDMDVKINVLRLQHYMSEGTFSNSAAFAENNPGHLIDTKQTTVLFDNVVMAREYIGPIRPGQ